MTKFIRLTNAAAEGSIILAVDDISAVPDYPDSPTIIWTKSNTDDFFHVEEKADDVLAKLNV